MTADPLLVCLFGGCSREGLLPPRAVVDEGGRLEEFDGARADDAFPPS